MLKALAASAVVVLAVLMLDHLSYSRLTFVYWFVSGSFLIGIARYVIRTAERHQRARGVGTSRCLVVGSGMPAERLVQRLRMFPDSGYELVGRIKHLTTCGQDELGASITEIVDRERVDVVFLSMPHHEQQQMLQIVSAGRRLNVEFRVVPSALEVIASEVEADQLAGIPILRIRRGLAMNPVDVRFKRMVDATLSAVGLMALLPIFVGIGVAIKLTTRGPILIRQERVGMHGQLFFMLKFRSMRVDAEEHSGPVWAVPGDKRRTVVGRLLRRFSLDELPQLWNVLRGDMSLVGPRPERPVFVAEFSERIPEYGDRHKVRPGLTGWAQMNDLRGTTPVEDRLVYDLYYIERWSLAFDVKIIMTTTFRLFTSKNAY